MSSTAEKGYTGRIPGFEPRELKVVKIKNEEEARTRDVQYLSCVVGGDYRRREGGSGEISNKNASTAFFNLKAKLVHYLVLVVVSERSNADWDSANIDWTGDVEWSNYLGVFCDNGASPILWNTRG
eukprot:g48216.t1